MTSMKLLRNVVLFSCCLLLASCGIFKGKKDEDNEPSKLSDVKSEVSLRKLWSVGVGSGQGDKFNRLEPVIAGEQIYAAGNNGTVVAVNLANGRTLWKKRLDYVITGGVGHANGMVLVASENSEVVALNDATGDVLWSAVVSSEVLSAPASNGRVVVVQSVDGKLTGLDATTGRQLWLYESTVPALSLRGNSAPIILNNFVIAAFANGSVVSVALDNGTLRWEERVAIPKGRSEIDRLVDIDGDLTVNADGQLLVPSYQGYFAVIDATTGQTRWRVEESSEVGASFGFGNIYMVNDQDDVKAYRTNQETLVWENTALLRRSLTSPVGFNNFVAVGDFEGYVHLLSQVDGRLVGRSRVDSSGIRGRMLAQGNTLYVYGNSGDLVALQVQ